MQRSRGAAAAGWGVAVLLLGSACGGGGGGDAVPVTSSPSQGVFAGVVRDDLGNPVAGARVSVDGIEAASLTGADGRFVVRDASLVTALPAPVVAGTLAAAVTAPGRRIAVLASGFAPFVSSLEVEEGDLAGVDLVRQSFELAVEVVAPRDGKVVVVNPVCDSSTVHVEGFVGLGPREGYRLDVVLVVDRSGSTSREGFDLDDDGTRESVLEAELAAAECFLGGLDPLTTRVAVVAFGDEAQRVHGFTDPEEAAEVGLAAVPAPLGGTNFEAALREAAALFVEQAAEDADAPRGEADAEAPPAPARAVVFLTDGVPTIRGYPERIAFDPEQPDATSNLTWDLGDARAAIAAAQDLATSTNAQLFGFSVVSSDDPNRPRKTLPHCVAECGGRYTDLTSVEDLEAALCGEALTDVVEVEIANLSTGGAPRRARLHSGGNFGGDVEVLAGQGTLNADGTRTQLVEVTARAPSVGSGLVATTQFTLRVVDLPTAASPGFDIDTAFRAPQTVAELPFLRNPQGDRITDDDLYDLLRGEYEDAVELIGADTFDTNAGSGTVTIQVDFVFKEACFKSDFGYVVIDPEHMPRNANQALAGVTTANRLFNSGGLGVEGCSLQSIPPSAQTHFEVEVPAGSVVAFFILPDRTLEQYLQKPSKGRAPLFTIPSLNPGDADQVMAFLSEGGRTEPGASTAGVTAGPMLVFCFEDQAVPDGSDRDYSDVVFTVRGVGGRLDDAGCEP